MTFRNGCMRDIGSMYAGHTYDLWHAFPDGTGSMTAELSDDRLPYGKKQPFTDGIVRTVCNTLTGETGKMEIKKYKSDKILYQIRHNRREIPEGKKYGNESIDHALSGENYSLISHGKNAQEIRKYVDGIMKKVFYYHKRKDVCRMVELVIQLPSDCPPEREKDFFNCCIDCLADKLPLGRDAIIDATVHVDEHKFLKDKKGNNVPGTDISKHHIHILTIPAVKSKMHDGFEYKLSAKELFDRNFLQHLHPDMQSALKSKNIPGTVLKKEPGSGKNISFTVSQLKEFSDRYGIVIDGSMTYDDIAKLINSKQLAREQVDLAWKNDGIQAEKIKGLEEQIRLKDMQITEIAAENLKLKDKVNELEIAAEKRTEEYERERSHLKELENQIAHYEHQKEIEKDIEITL